MGRAIAFVFIAAVFPAIILADDITTTPKPNDNCLNSTEFKKLKKAEIPKLMDCWSDIISIFANETKPYKTCHGITDIQEHVESYFKLANETCPGFDWNIRSTTFMEMLMKTSENIAVFQKFYNAGCKNLANYTDSCYHAAYSGVNPRNINWYQRFNLHYTLELGCVSTDAELGGADCDLPIEMGQERSADCEHCDWPIHGPLCSAPPSSASVETHPNYPETVPPQNMTCNVARDVKKCTITELNNNCPDTVNYVSSLFDVSLDINCPLETKKPVQKSPNSANITAGSSTVLLMLTMPLILVQYLLTY